MAHAESVARLAADGEADACEFYERALLQGHTRIVSRFARVLREEEDAVVRRRVVEFVRNARIRRETAGVPSLGDGVRGVARSVSKGVGKGVGRGVLSGVGPAGSLVGHGRGLRIVAQNRTAQNRTAGATGSLASRDHPGAGVGEGGWRGGRDGGEDGDISGQGGGGGYCCSSTMEMSGWWRVWLGLF